MTLKADQQTADANLVPSRRRLVALLALLALAGCGGSSSPDQEREVTSAAPKRAEEAEMPPLPEARPQLVEPVAGAGNAAVEDLPTVSDDDTSLPKPTGPASGSSKGDTAKGAGVSGLDADTARALPNGVALPPLDAPEQVLDVIRAGNIIARSPYKWGGGHGRFQDNGYDCSGSVSYALYYAGLLDKSYTSGELMHYGKPGKGKWITLYANPGHIYMVVAGIRFDTSGARNTGSRWQNDLRETSGYAVRHPPGL